MSFTIGELGRAYEESHGLALRVSETIAELLKTFRDDKGNELDYYAKSSERRELIHNIKGDLEKAEELLKQAVPEKPSLYENAAFYAIHGAIRETFGDFKIEDYKEIISKGAKMIEHLNITGNFPMARNPDEHERFLEDYEVLAKWLGQVGKSNPNQVNYSIRHKTAA